MTQKDGPNPRLCVIRRWPDFQGYGFNLQAEQGASGHFVGDVDPGSPAEASGLRSGDRIIEVNDENVQGESHTRVVQLIRSQPNSVRMLAIDPEGEKYYATRGVTITRHMSNVIEGDSEERSPISRNNTVEVVSTRVDSYVGENMHGGDGKGAGTRASP